MVNNCPQINNILHLKLKVLFLVEYLVVINFISVMFSFFVVPGTTNLLKGT